MNPSTINKPACPVLPKGGPAFGRFVRDGAIAVGIALFCLVLLELVLRSFFPQTLVATRIQGEHFSIRDEVIGIRYVPGARWRFAHPEYTAEYAINSDGFRDAKEHPVPKAAGTIRILLLGDSFTFGLGVNYEQTWAVIAERLLAESGNGDVDLVKAGIEGMDTRSELILMRELVEKYQPDAIAVGFLLNDVESNSLYGIEGERHTPVGVVANARALEAEGTPADSWFKAMRQRIIRRPSGKTLHLQHLLTRLLLTSEDVYSKLYLASPWGDYLRDPWPPAVMQKVKITEILFKKMSDYARLTGKKLVVLSIAQQFQALYSSDPSKSDHVDVTLYDRHFSEIASQQGFGWVTTLESLKKAIRGHTEAFYRWDGHLTPDGHRVVAEVFVQQVIPLLDTTR